MHNVEVEHMRCLVKLLASKGMQIEDADDAVNDALKDSVNNGTSLMCAINKRVNSKKRKDPVTMQLRIIMPKLRGSIELEKLASLFAEF